MDHCHEKGGKPMPHFEASTQWHDEALHVWSRIHTISFTLSDYDGDDDDDDDDEDDDPDIDSHL